MFTFRPHEHITDPNNNTVQVRHLHDYVCLYNEGLRYFIQHGTVYANGGVSIPREGLPDWFWEQVRALTPETRRSCEFLLPEDEPVLRPQPSLRSQLQSLSDQERLEILQAFAPSVAQESTPMPTQPKSPTVHTPRPPWVCDNCGDSMETRLKGVHLARLKRLGRC